MARSGAPTTIRSFTKVNARDQTGALTSTASSRFCQ